jgi:chromosome segregation ATPase
MKGLFSKQSGSFSMAKVGAQRAAIMTGRSKSTIQRAMKAGRLSFEIDDQGQKLIDVSELERVFGPVTEQEENTSLATVKAEIKRAHDLLEMERLKMRVHSLEDQLHITQVQLDDVKDQRDQWQKQAQQVLLTNQFSQKQAEDLKQELRDREARERAIRQRQMEDRLRRMQAQNQNNETSDENNIWGRLLKKIGGIR